VKVTLRELRWLLFASATACLLLASVSNASAQGSDPLPNCQVKFLHHKGPELTDPETRAVTVSVDVHFFCDGIEVLADEVTFDDKTVTAHGNVLVMQQETTPSGEQVRTLSLTADRMEMDRQTRLATFYHAYGTARIANQGDKTMFGRQEPDIMFYADKIERLGPKKYRLTHGAFTTCLQPNPRWQMIGGSGTVVLGDHASMTNVRFMVKDIPVLYVPYLYYPLTKNDRSRGLLIPSYSSSGIRGNGLSNAYFIPIGLSQDATLFYDYFTKAGQGAAAEYRFASAPGAGGTARFHAFFEKEQLTPEGAVERAAHTSYDFAGQTSQSLGHGFRLTGNSYYFTDITTQQRYQQGVQAATNPRRNISMEVSGPIKLGPAASHAPLMNIRGLYKRDEIFSGTQSSLQGWAPKVNVSINNESLSKSRQSFFARVYYSTSAEVAYLQSRPLGQADAPAPQTNVRRFDTNSAVRAPLPGLPEYLSVTTSAAWRLTEYFDSRDPVTNVVGPIPLTRSVFDLRADVTGPSLGRVFRTPDSHFAQGFTHTIDPRVTFEWLSPFDQAGRIFVIDQVDQVAAGTTSVAYSLTNTIRIKPNGSTQLRPFLSVAIGQKYYSNAQAARVDPSNPIAGAGTLSPVQIGVTVTPKDGIYGQFNVYKNTLQWPLPGTVQPSTQFNGSTTVRLNHDRLVLVGGWSKTNYYTAAQGFIDLPPVSALNASTSVNMKEGRIGATYGFNFDVVHQKLLQQHVVGYYHAQCCGFAVDYQAYSTLSTTVPTDRRFAVTFTLAGIGSFSPPLGSFAR